MTETRRTASILSIALPLALGTGTAAHAQRADKAMVTDIVPEAIGEVSYSDWLYYGVVDSIGGAISWIGGIAGSSSEVVTGSPMDWVESVDATETLSLWQLLNDAGYKLKEIDTHVALIPDVELKFAYVRELSEADRVYLERKLDRAAQQLQEMRTRARNLLSVPGQALTGLRLEVVGLATPRAASFDAGVPEQPPATMAERWPAYRTAELRLEQERIRLAFAADQERPDASLEVGASSHSLRENQLGGAIGDALRLRHPGWYAGVALEVPLDNGAARGKRQAQALRVEAARLQLQSESVNLDNEWAIRRGQLLAALGERKQLQREVEGREALMRAERENYDLGRGRLRSLIEAQDRLGDSRLRLLDAEVRAELAILGLQAASGELLDLFDVRTAP